MGLELPQRMPRRLRRAGLSVVAALALLVLASCSQQETEEWERLAMPVGASDRSDSVQALWNGAWIAALVTGVVVWGLIIYTAIRFRRRSDDEVPVQTRYNLPMEILYTVAPVVMVLVFFKFTIDAQNEVQADVAEPDHNITVVGQQWSWTFNYVEEEAIGGETVHFAGTPAEPPTLVLPVDETVKFTLRSPDVVHSFWVPSFLYKLDVIPGRTNSFSMTPTRVGTYEGRCAELCGVYHSRMLFQVEVVSAEEYADYLRTLQAQGNTGLALGGENAETKAGLVEGVQDDDTTTGDQE